MAGRCRAHALLTGSLCTIGEWPQMAGVALGRGCMRANEIQISQVNGSLARDFNLSSTPANPIARLVVNGEVSVREHTLLMMPFVHDVTGEVARLNCGKGLDSQCPSVTGTYPDIPDLGSRVACGPKRRG